MAGRNGRYLAPRCSTVTRRARVSRSIADLIALTGTQGIELLNGLTRRGALPDEVARVHANYHIPISNTASGRLAMESI